MTQYELAMEILKDKEHLSEQVNVRDENGNPTRKFAITRYNDVVGVYLEGYKEGYN